MAVIISLVALLSGALSTSDRDVADGHPRVQRDRTSSSEETIWTELNWLDAWRIGPKGDDNRIQELLYRFDDPTPEVLRELLHIYASQDPVDWRLANRVVKSAATQAELDEVLQVAVEFDAPK
jgi:hypothetical protein